MVISGTIVDVKAGVITIRRDDASLVKYRPQFSDWTWARVGDRVSATRGRIWRVATRPALETKNYVG
jgi:hypothetical protein